MSYSYRSPDKRRQPAPYAHIRLYPPDINVFDDSKTAACLGLLDTASETTYIPEYLLKEELGLCPVGNAEDSIGVGGVATYYPFIVDLLLGNQRITNEKVFGWEKTTALIGRNILDNFHVCFDGHNFYFR